MNQFTQHVLMTFGPAGRVAQELCKAVVEVADALGAQVVEIEHLWQPLGDLGKGVDAGGGAQGGINRLEEIHRDRQAGMGSRSRVGTQPDFGAIRTQEAQGPPRRQRAGRHGSVIRIQ